MLLKHVTLSQLYHITSTSLHQSILVICIVSLFILTFRKFQSNNCLKYTESNRTRTCRHLMSTKWCFQHHHVASPKTSHSVCIVLTWILKEGELKTLQNAYNDHLPQFIFWGEILDSMSPNKKLMKTGVVGRVVLCNWSPACTVKYRQSSQLYTQHWVWRLLRVQV